jgi:hypothetical protein
LTRRRELQASQAAKSHRLAGRSAVTGLLGQYQKTGGVVARDWEFLPGFLYTQVRAISARVNQNYDGWPSAELKKSYRSFVGKPVFVNHQNEDPDLARGRVVAARYVERGRDKYIETVMEIDAKRFPKLAKEIISGGLDSVSMGVEAGFTICSVCDNKATDVFDMCKHIKFRKGEKMRNEKTGKNTLVYENCFKLGFFELSYVFDPADETAVVSRVIAANRTAQEGTPLGWDRFQPTHKETDQVWHPDSHAYQDHQPVNQIKRGLDPEATNVYDNASMEEKAYLDPLDFYSPYKPSKQQYQVPPQQHPVNRMSKSQPAKRAPSRQKKRGGQMTDWYKVAFGETKAPEDIDTLRDESEDDTDLFHHWVESPPELRAPDMDKTQRLDREQESQGLDSDRNAEDAEEFGGSPQEPQFVDDQHQEPVMPINPPELKKSRRNKNRGARMSGYHFYAADDDGDDGDFGGSESDDEDTQTPEDSDSDDGGGADDGGADPQSGDDIHQLLDEAQSDLDSFEQDPDSGYDDDASDDGDSFGDDDDYSDEADEDSDPSDDYAGDEAGGSDEGGEDQGAEDQGGGEDASGGSQPPWLQEGNVNRQASRRNKRGGTMTGSTLSERGRVASRGRRHIADDGHTDGGPYGIDDSQGNQEDVFISQVPGAEAVAAPAPGDPQISNGPGNLVAYKRPKFDPAHYQRLADVVKALPPEQRAGMARKMVAMLTADNKAFNGKTFYAEANVPVVKRGNRYFYAEDLTDPDKVDPGLSGTDVQDLKGDDFESLALENVETQPKDASIHAFRQFDSWLAQATGGTANQHRNANFIRRAAATYAKQWQNPQAKLATLFPTLDYVLAEARKFEGGNMRRQAEDKSLEVAAPQDRIDVEAPVKNVTDADAQASQFDLSDFAHNAGDPRADPVLDVVDGNAGTWAPDKGKESSVKLATAVEAVRLAEAYIAAYPNSYSNKDRWTLTGQFETLRQAVVRDRTRLLEAVVEDNAKRPKTARKVSAASSRGTKGSIPPGFASGRTASTARRASASDPATDYGLFL